MPASGGTYQLPATAANGRFRRAGVIGRPAGDGRRSTLAHLRAWVSCAGMRHSLGTSAEETEECTPFI